MEKVLLNRMLCKKERHRLRRKAWRKFLRCHPNWIEGMETKPHWNEKRKNVEDSRFKNIYNSSRDSLWSWLLKMFKQLFRKGE
jgi:hypothetical protein